LYSNPEITRLLAPLVNFRIKFLEKPHFCRLRRLQELICQGKGREAKYLNYKGRRISGLETSHAFKGYLIVSKSKACLHIQKITDKADGSIVNDLKGIHF
jgi:hypothetical protein